MGDLIRMGGLGCFVFSLGQDKGEFGGGRVDFFLGDPEANAGAADADFVAVLERGGAIDAVLVEGSAVSALEVAQDISHLALPDLTMLSAGAAVINDDMVVVGASDSNSFTVQKDATLRLFVIDVKDRHCDSPSTATQAATGRLPGVYDAKMSVVCQS